MSQPRRNISVACQACRRRKVRCDGVQPTCARCSRKGIACDFAQSIDQRKENRPHRRIAELEAEVKRLEIELQNARLGGLRGLSETDAADYLNSNKAVTHWDEDSDNSDGNGQGPTDYRAVDSLQVDTQSGRTVFLGPTSIPPRPDLGPPDNGGLQWFPGLPTATQDQPEAFQWASQDSSELLDLYFTFLNGFCAFVDETTFRRDMETMGPSGTSSNAYSAFLHCSILAFAAHISNRPTHAPSPEQGPGTKGINYMQEAVKLFAKEIERPRPSTVTGLVFLWMFLADLGKTSMAWLYSGMAVRLAQELGLHINSQPLVDDGKMSTETAMLRSHSFWTIYVEDKLMALYLGRAPAVTDNDFNLPMPLEAENITDPGALHGFEHALITLGEICTRILRLLYGLKGIPERAHRESAEIKKSLQEWPERLPAQLRLGAGFSLNRATPQVMTIHATYNTVVILFYRTLMRRHCLDAPDGQRCFEAALSTLAIARGHDLTYGFRRAPITMSQNLYVAGSVLVLILADLFDQDEKATQRETAHQSLDEVLSLLSVLAESWGCARQALNALEALKPEYGVESESQMAALTKMPVAESWQWDAHGVIDWRLFDSLTDVEDNSLDWLLSLS